MTYKDKGSYESSPPCTQDSAACHTYNVTGANANVCVMVHSMNAGCTLIMLHSMDTDICMKADMGWLRLVGCLKI